MRGNRRFPFMMYFHTHRPFRELSSLCAPRIMPEILSAPHETFRSPPSRGRRTRRDSARPVFPLVLPHRSDEAHGGGDDAGGREEPRDAVGPADR